MTPRSRIEPEASDELGEAALWYEAQRDGLGREFLAATEAALDFIALFPQAGTAVGDLAPELPVRWVPVKRFPFHIVYLEQPEAIRILAIAHDRRFPGYWRSRMAT